MSGEARIRVVAQDPKTSQTREIPFGAKAAPGEYIVRIDCPPTTQAVRLIIVGISLTQEQYRIRELSAAVDPTDPQVLFAPISIQRITYIDGKRRYIAAMLFFVAFDSPEEKWKKVVLHTMVRVSRRS